MIDFGDAPDSGSPAPRSSGGSAAASASKGPRKFVARTLAPGETLKYVENLNPPQKEAVLATEGPLIVLAGAGSGKTKMLTSRIAYLMDVKGVPAWSILAVTFTNKAAKEMQERVTRHLQESPMAGGTPEIGTFHAICVRLLRREMQATPFTRPFVIYDSSDQLSLVKSAIDKLGIDEKAFSAKSMQAGIDRLKCDAIEPHELEPSPHDLFERNLQRVYEQYQKDLFANNALDFSEILTMTYRILRDHPIIRSKYQNRWAYVHVDEYQDTNRAQYLLLNMLAKKEFGGHENICVVGDEDQSIYKWRGADIRNILDFEKDYPGARIVKLEQNYRSTKTIITAASELIKNNKERKDKNLWTENLQGPLIVRAGLADEKAEAEFVVAELKRLSSYEGHSYSDFSIFYRTHAQSRQFEEVMRREKIPYEIVGGLRFYDRKEIKDVLSYFRLIQNPNDSVSLKRVINVPGRGIGKTTIDKIDQVQRELETGVRKVDQSDQLELSGASGIPETSLWAALQLITREHGIVAAGTQKKLVQFVGLVERFMASTAEMMPSELYHLILDETGYVQELREENTDEAKARIENLEEFDTLLQEFEERQREDSTEAEFEEKKSSLLSIFLEESTLATDVTAPGERETAPHVVSMMSLHSSKGLEYPVVFLVGMEEGLFPSKRASGSEDEDDMEEERRLAYVGVTRAREQLYLSHASIRRIWGQVTYQEPARFFQEIPEELVDFKDLSFGTGATQYGLGSSRAFNGGQNRWTHESNGGGGKKWDDFSQVTQYADNDTYKSASSGIPAHPRSAGHSKIGLRLAHPDYGAGKIVGQEGNGKDEKVTVQFSRGGNRKFLTRFVEGFIETD